MSKLLIVLAVAVTFSFAAPVFADEAPANVVSEAASTDCAGAEGDALARSCGKCGDGYCSKSCGENALTCPKDCGEVES